MIMTAGQQQSCTLAGSTECLMATEWMGLKLPLGYLATILGYHQCGMAYTDGITTAATAMILFEQQQQPH